MLRAACRRERTPVDFHSEFAVASPSHPYLTSLKGFEWLVRDVDKLRDHIEGEESDIDQDEVFEILKESPMMGDNKVRRQPRSFFI